MTERPRPQPWPVRLTHWMNAVLLVVMAGSGLQILVAYPYQGARGALYPWFPLQGWVPPAWLTFGAWLAGARHWHFALAWLLVINALVYLGYLLGSGEWRQRWFLARRDLRAALSTAWRYARLRRTPESGELYNGLQRLAYSAVLALAILEVLTGLALYKPVQLQWLTAAFGGYDFARFLHFLGLVLLAGFTLGHVIMVALHPRTLGEMVTGGKRRE